MKRFEDKVALVTGAASGIGRSIAERLAAEGARVACVDVQEEALQSVVAGIEASGGEALGVSCDVSDPAAVDRAVLSTVERFGGLDVLSNNAGILRFDHTHELELDDWNRVLAINLTGTFLMCKAAIPHLLEAKGCIVNMGSISANCGHAWAAAYAASKGGLQGLTHTLATEYGRQGLRANCVAAGGVDTPIREQFRFPEGADQSLVYRIMPLDKHRGPESVSGLVAFLASDEAAHVNGATIRVDGGTMA